MPSLKPDCTCALQRKAGTLTAFAPEQSVLYRPVCPGTIAKYGQFSRISEVEDATFSVVQTAWRRERDSNPRYPFRYSGFQDRLFQPLTHPSNLCANVLFSLHSAILEV